ncbi:MAG: HAMP domain-containing histidine kinase [Silicimonas sp.]|nr:HAMP domain-containing histidine kinase [Silicimonas sp.]
MEAVLEARAAGLPLPPPGFGQSVAVVSGGQVVAGDVPPHVLAEDAAGFHDLDGGPGNLPDQRLFVQPVAGGRVVVAERVERQEELREVLAGGLQIALFGSILATVLAALWMARGSQFRLDRIGAALARVAHGDLAARIDLPDRGDDLSLLARRIDETTERLENSVEQLRVQSANIAHDLRTPLARLRALIETRLLALSERGAPVEAEDLETALEQIDRMVGTFDALLRISRIESGARMASFVPLDPGEIAQSIAEVFGPVVEDAGQSLVFDLQQPVPVRGDPELITQAIANLIQNALRYGRAGQQVVLAVRGAQIAVTDEGPGVPLAERDKVLAPLYQLAADRQGEGFGLGLALVRAVADLHDAVLTLADGPGGRGLAVRMRFPKMTEM